MTAPTRWQCLCNLAQSLTPKTGDRSVSRRRFLRQLPRRRPLARTRPGARHPSAGGAGAEGGWASGGIGRLTATRSFGIPKCQKVEVGFLLSGRPGESGAVARLRRSTPKNIQRRETSKIAEKRTSGHLHRAAPQHAPDIPRSGESKAASTFVREKPMAHRGRRRDDRGGQAANTKRWSVSLRYETTAS